MLRNLLLLSWPVLTLEGAYIVSQTLDMVWVGRLGTASIAGVGAGLLIFVVVSSILQGFVIGARAMVARFMGAGEVTSANHVAKQALMVSVAYGVVTAAIGFFSAKPILSLLGLKTDVVAEGAAFLNIMFAGWVGMSVWRMIYSIMQASGDPVTPMKIEVFFRSIHVVLCPFLVLGWGVFPRLGVGGAALTNVVTEAIGMGIGLWALFKGRTRLQLIPGNFRLDSHILWRVVKIGFPACIVSVQRIFADVLLMWFMVPFGTKAVAAHSLGLRVQHIVFMPGVAMGNGAGVVVGQNLGAHQPARAERSGWLAVGLIEGLMVACSIAILVWAENIIHIFSIEPDLVELTGVFLRIAAVGYSVIGFVYVLQSCISGAGDTLPPMIFSLFMIWVVQLPLASLLPRVTDLGVYGVRWAIVAGMLAGAAAYATYFRSGRWRRKRI